MVYRSNVVRFVDKKNNKSLIQFNDEYDDNGLLKKITFSFIGVGSSSGILKDSVYDFENISVNDQPYLKDNRLATIEEFKDYILNLFNKNPKFNLVCPKENCNDPNCKPRLSIGNKITQSTNTKQPYFSSNCAGIDYDETPEHLNAKINIHKLLMEKASYYTKKNSSTKIENIEIEKSFSFGEGQERRADVYYEKHYLKSNGELQVEKFAIEVQRNNISYEELQERTKWDKEQGIATFWVVVDKIFDRKQEVIDSISKKDFNIPLLKLIGFSMNQYKDRFFIYDDQVKKIIPLTIIQKDLAQFNNLDEYQQKSIKSKFSMDNVYVISTIKENNYYKLLPYKVGRVHNQVGSDILSFGVYQEEQTLVHKVFNKNSNKYEFANFLKLGNNIQDYGNKQKPTANRI